MPIANAYIDRNDLLKDELSLPLTVFVCTNCWLVQSDCQASEFVLFDRDYAYFSAYSSSWIEHCEEYTQKIIGRLKLGADNLVVEIAANDGCLLQFFLYNHIPCYGVEPTASTAANARARHLNIVEDFFSEKLAIELARKGQAADLIIANNVLAHVPDIKDFVKGISILLKPHGTVTFEFPHLINLVQYKQFDTIYHEHYSYLSLTSVNTILNQCGLKIYDVETIFTHGGSLRLYAQITKTGSHPINPSVLHVQDTENKLGLSNLGYYKNFQQGVNFIRYEVLEFLKNAKLESKTVAAYGAAAKGNTMLNYCGVTPDLIEFVVDKNPQKIGKYLPGSRIPIVNESYLTERKPDYIVVLPWNLIDEIKNQLKYTKKWGAVLVTIIPQLTKHPEKFD